MYQNILDEDSMMSLDENYDPEVGIYITNFENISRMLDYKAVILKYMVGTR